MNFMGNSQEHAKCQNICGVSGFWVRKKHTQFEERMKCTVSELLLLLLHELKIACCWDSVIVHSSPSITISQRD